MKDGDMTVANLDAISELFDAEEAPLSQSAPPDTPGTVSGQGNVPVESFEFFSIERTPDDKLVVTTGDSDIVRVIRTATNLPVMGDGYPVDTIVENYDNLTKAAAHYRNDPAISELLLFLQRERVKNSPEAQARLRDGVVRFEDLPIAFAEGMEVLFPDEDDPIGGVVRSVERGYTFSGEPFWAISVDVIMAAKGAPHVATHSGIIRFFDGLMKLTSLGIRPLTAEMKAVLTERGKAFRQYCTGVHFTAYKGQFIRRSYWGDRHFRADGRIMIDVKTLRRSDPDLGREIMKKVTCHSEDGDSPAMDQADLHDDKLFMCWPFLYGFSLTTKVWGELRVADVSPIEFRTDAFDHLVMPDDKKKLVRAQVEYNGSGFQDIIDSKGGGCIFLLHGPPGVGKTLTAEAVAEVLRRPLYSVSVGELGITPRELEESLRTILDVAQTWNAVLLLDEADIFLEARDERDIARNAMVGVFLRLLEYHQGVLFLTTNRVRNFDRAFHSRISIALNYPEMDKDTRQAIWHNLMRAAGLGHIDMGDLDIGTINGRQIKNAIRLSQTLAKSEGVEVNADHLRKTLAIGVQFEQDLLNAEEWSAKQEQPIRSGATLSAVLGKLGGFIRRALSRI